jgi:hypothetical protein
LIINGKPAPPLWLLYPEDFPTHIQFLAREVQDAESHGVNTVSVALNSWPWDNQNTAPLDFSAPDQVIDNILPANPQALLVLNIGVWPGTGWVPPVSLTAADYIWRATGDVVITDRSLLVIHAAAAGPDGISLPTGVSATPLGGGSSSTGTLNITFSRVGETQWFQLSQSFQGAKSPVHRRPR